MSVLKDELRADRVRAMKARDELTKRTLGMVLTAIQRAETEGEAHDLTDAEVLTILKKEAASRKDSAAAYQAGGRQDLVEKELAEVEILQHYLPAPLTEAELDQIVAEQLAKVAAELGEAVTMRQMGVVIKAVNAAAQGRAEGAVVAAKVRAALA
jgi:uncharacterized protein YqeY